MAIPIRSPEEVDALARAGVVLDGVLRAGEDAARPGSTTRAVGDAIDAAMRCAGARAVLRGYAGSSLEAVGQAQAVRAFPAAACVCVNEEVVHAPPGVRIVREGDVVTIDAALELDGWCVDAARTIAVGECARGVALRDAARAVTAAACDACGPGVRWASVVHAARRAAVGAGVVLLDDFCGHGVGRSVHEPPRLSFRPSAMEAHADGLVLWPGMVLCIEPVVAELCGGSDRAGGDGPSCVTLDDGWTVLTPDRRWAAHEEVCLAITVDGWRRLAGGGGGRSPCLSSLSSKAVDHWG